MMRTGVRYLGTQKPIRIVVVGERGTGKSSLIMAAAEGFFYPNIPPMLPRINLPSEYFLERIPATIIDTSSRPEDREEVIKEVKIADAIVLTFAFDRPETFDRLSDYWIPLFRQLEVRVPIVVAGYKVGIEWAYNQMDILQITAPLMRQCQEIEISFKWSIEMLHEIPWRAQEIFMHAHESAIHPFRPIYDQETNLLTPRCVAALRRVFLISSHTRDYVLTDADLNYIQMKCFHQSLTLYQCEELKRIVQVRCPYGVNQKGIKWEGFLYLNRSYVEAGKLKIIWTILRKFGYTNDLRLREDLIPLSSINREADQSVELTTEALGFLSEVYEFFDQYGDNNVEPGVMAHLFQTTPECAWNEAPYNCAAELTENGGLSLETFLSLWSLMTLIDPAKTLEYLICIRYPYDPSLAVTVTRRRSEDLKEKKCEREVVQCFVFGPSNAGKSALLNRFIGRPYDNVILNGSTEERYAVNIVDTSEAKKFLVLKEMKSQEDGFSVSNEALASCDVAIFVYDSSDEASWKKATELLAEVATISKDAGFVFPCLMVAAKTDLDSFPREVQESNKVTKDLEIGTPVPISSKLGEFNQLFLKILTAAENPHLSIPEIKPKKKESSKLIINRALMTVSIGAGALMAGWASFRLYAARKQRKWFGFYMKDATP